MKHIAAENRRGIRLKPVLWNFAVLLILAACVLLPRILTELRDYRQFENYTPIEGLNNNTGQDVTAAIQRMQAFAGVQEDIQNWQIVDDYNEKYSDIEFVLYARLSEMNAADLISDQVLVESHNLFDFELTEEMIIEKGDRTDQAGQTFEWYSINIGMYHVSMSYHVESGMVMDMELNLPSYIFEDENDLETYLKNYIAWLGLDGLSGWTLNNRTEEGNGFEIIEASAADVPFVLNVTRNIIRTADDEIYCISFGTDPIMS